MSVILRHFNGESQNLQTLLLRAVDMFPTSLKPILLSIVQESKFPSPATLSRTRLYIDVAYILYMRLFHNVLLKDKDTAMNVLVDVFQTQGRNIFLAEYYGAHGNLLLQAADGVKRMEDLPHEPWDPQTCEITKAYCEVLIVATFHHLFPPMVMA